MQETQVGRQARWLEGLIIKLLGWLLCAGWARTLADSLPPLDGLHTWMLGMVSHSAGRVPTKEQPWSHSVCMGMYAYSRRVSFWGPQLSSMSLTLGYPLLLPSPPHTYIQFHHAGPSGGQGAPNARVVGHVQPLRAGVHACMCGDVGSPGGMRCQRLTFRLVWHSPAQAQGSSKAPLHVPERTHKSQVTQATYVTHRKLGEG